MIPDQYTSAEIYMSENVVCKSDEQTCTRGWLECLEVKERLCTRLGNNEPANIDQEQNYIFWRRPTVLQDQKLIVNKKVEFLE